MAHYLVTGGAGFIGSHIVEALVHAGHTVRVLDDLSSGNASNLTDIAHDVEVVPGDVRDLATVKRCMRGVECVIHQAAIVSVTQSVADPVNTHGVTAGGTFNVLVAARDAGVRRVVCASTSAVYGDNPNVPLGETELPRPLSPYAAAKLTGENYGAAFARVYGLSTVFLRYFNVYGPRQSPHGDYAGVIAKFISLMSAGRIPVIFGDGCQTRDFVYVADVVRANLLAASEAGIPAGAVINIATGRSVSLIELVSTLNAVLGTAFAPRFASPRLGDILHSGADVTSAAATLRFSAQTDLQHGLTGLAAWMRQAPVNAEQMSR